VAAKTVLSVSSIAGVLGSVPRPTTLILAELCLELLADVLHFITQVLQRVLHRLDGRLLAIGLNLGGRGVRGGQELLRLVDAFAHCGTDAGPRCTQCIGRWGMRRGCLCAAHLDDHLVLQGVGDAVPRKHNRLVTVQLPA
jgi:hypothetical protein